MKSVVLDTNILAYYVIHNKVLNILKQRYKSLGDDFLRVYESKYRKSIELISNLQETKHEVFVTVLSLNELFSAIKRRN